MHIRIRPRKHGPVSIEYLAQWYYPPRKHHQRSFATMASAQAWIAEIRADPALADGEKLADRIAADNARRYQRDMLLRRTADTPVTKLK